MSDETIEEPVDLHPLLRDEKLMAHLEGSGLKRIQALQRFTQTAAIVAQLDADKAVKGEWRVAHWKRKYNDAESVTKTVLTLPLAFVHLWRLRDKEIAYTTVHRLHPESVSEYRIQRFCAAMIQALFAVFTAFLCLSTVSLLFALSSEGAVPSHYLLLLPTLLMIWLCIRGYKWAKRYGVPEPLRMFSANGLFEYHGLKKK